MIGIYLRKVRESLDILDSIIVDIAKAKVHIDASVSYLDRLTRMATLMRARVNFEHLNGYKAELEHCKSELLKAIDKITDSLVSIGAKKNE